MISSFPEAKVVKQFKSTTSLVLAFNGKIEALSNLELKKEEIDYIVEKKKDKKDLAVINQYHRNLFVFIEPEQLKPDPVEYWRRKGAKVEQLCTEEGVDTIGVDLGSLEANLAFMEGSLLSAYRFNKYFNSKLKKESSLKRIHFLSKGNDETRISELVNTSQMVWKARTWVNEPQSYLNATQFAKEIKKESEALGIAVDVWTKEQIVKEKMGGLLAVNQGSEIPPVFVILHYKPKKTKNKKPIVLVGKGVVYDTGGLSLKPTANSMDIMKCDMGGAAAMVGTILSVAANQLENEVYALIPLTDNRPGKDAYAPGDVVTMYDGTTVEVLNTDAEGRMIMADALAYAKKLNPCLTIDAATLTGAAERAIGVYASCAMGNAKSKDLKALEQAGKESFERVVLFPFWEEYYEEMKSSIADLKNIGSSNAGMITAGKFLEHFAPKPYIHIDIAGPAFVPEKRDYIPKGGTGVGVRLLYNFIKNYEA
ncbi:MAG: leucyl aminopeptidase family protein [Luteibaculum sp.]